MPYFHATWRDNLPSIQKHGLGGAVSGRRNFDCIEGVYLAAEPAVALSMLIEAYMMKGESWDVSPPDAVEGMCVIVVDDSRIDTARIEADPNVDVIGQTFLYRGKIDVTSLPVLNVDDVLVDRPTVEEAREMLRI